MEELTALPQAKKRFNRIIVVSYRLPFRLVTGEDGKKTTVPNAGGLVSAMSALTDQTRCANDILFADKKIVWVGKGDDLPETPPPGKKRLNFGDLVKKYLLHMKDITRRSTDLFKVPNELSEKYQLVPVTIDQTLNEKYYGGFCNDCIWPLFHYFPSLVSNDESYFESYIEANQLFADAITAIARPDDFIWINDYQLFLVPEMVRRSIPDANIGFFLHIPFPYFEIFRILPHRWRDAILNGILGSDLIGFHTNDYSRYFLRSVSRLLGYETTMNTVMVEDRLVRVDTFPIGIDYDKYHDAAKHSPDVAAAKETILKTLKDQKLIFSADRLDYSKGLLERLHAFEYFLESYPEWLEKIVFNMVVVPSRDTIVQYQNMKREIDMLVGRINGKYSTMAWRPIVYQYKTLSFSELVALYDLSVVGLITPIRDGMNLVAKEYVACQVTEKGVLVLSEMAGAAAELNVALLINPTDKHDVAEAINEALTMPSRERSIRISRMQKHIRNYTVFAWARDIIESLIAVKAEQAQRRVNVITPAIMTDILARYRDAARRIIFLDYDGTFVPFASVPELAVPDTRALQRLRTLAEAKGNTVVLISGRDKNFLEEWLGPIDVHLIAEHGAFYREPGGRWETNIDPDQSWKTEILPVLQRFADHCNGASIEEKSFSLSWHYRNAAPEIGVAKANELKDELRTLVATDSKLYVLDGNMVVEVKRTGYDKGIAAAKFVAERPSDFIIAFGDDKTDEDLFRALTSDAVTIKIGLKTSVAKYNLVTQKEVARFIERMIEQHQTITPQERN